MLVYELMTTASAFSIASLLWSNNFSCFVLLLSVLCLWSFDIKEIDFHIKSARLVRTNISVSLINNCMSVFQSTSGVQGSMKATNEKSRNLT